MTADLNGGYNCHPVIHTIDVLSFASNARKWDPDIAVYILSSSRSEL